MSGFLQRIASSAVRPKPNAHPFVESIYPPAARRNRAAEPMEQYGIFKAPVEEATEQSSRSGLSMEEDRLANKVLTQLEEMRSQQPESVAEREFLQPLLPQQEIEANFALKRGRRNGEESGTVSFPASSALHQELASTPAALEYVPLVADHFARTDASDLREVHPLLAPGDADPESARALQGRQSSQVQTRSTSQQADDIQIHIGRIEVVAVPQAAPRPAAAPARKGLSLDEYLSRRNGRAG